MRALPKSVAIFCAAVTFGTGAALLTSSGAEARNGRRGDWAGYDGGWAPGLAVAAGVGGLAAGAVATGVYSNGYVYAANGYYPVSAYTYYGYPPLPAGYYYSAPTVCYGRAPVYDGYGTYLGYKRVRVAC